nr:MAG TPA: hypothetical protein [Caudoviricetes sp.]
MKNYAVYIYASKSNRKNAKTVSKHFNIWPDSQGLKARFTEHMDFPEVKQWAESIKEAYPVFHVVAYINDTNICSWEANSLSEHQAVTTVIAIMRLFNAYAEV